MEEIKHCKWYSDEFCTNGDSPCVADYCPVVEYPELCKYREEVLVKDKSKEVNDLVKENTELIEKIEKYEIIGWRYPYHPYQGDYDLHEFTNSWREARKLYQKAKKEYYSVFIVRNEKNKE